MTQALTPGAAFPVTAVPRLGGGEITLGRPATGDWQLIVVYRGLHCPLCKKYLPTLEAAAPELAAIGIEAVAVSGDPEAKAAAMVAETGLTLPMGHGLTIPQMTALGLFISDPRSAQETDRPFPEPGVFVVNDAGALQIVDISNAPFARPDLAKLTAGLKFVRENAYPIRGTHAA